MITPQIQVWLEYYGVEPTPEIVEYFEKEDELRSIHLKHYWSRPQALKDAEKRLEEERAAECKRQQEQWNKQCKQDRKQKIDYAPSSIVPGEISKLLKGMQ